MQSPKTILVIGGTGFLGRYVVKALTEQGWRVKVVSRTPSKVMEMKTAGDCGQVACISGDLAMPETVIRHMDGVDAVVNLVGILFESGGKQRFNMLHTIGAEKVAEAAQEKRIRTLIHVSALGVDRAAASAYAHTKYQGEKAVMTAFPRATILRPSVVFGAEDNFFNQFARMAANLHVWPLIGGGKTRFQPVYAGDVARMALEAIRQPERSAGQVFELGGARVMSMAQIFDYIQEVTGLKGVRIPLSFSMASMMGAVMQMLPFRPMLTADQVMLLKYDNVISGNMPGMEALGISPAAVEAIVPAYLQRYRKGSK